MTQSDKAYISEGYIELGRCLISLTNLYKAGFIEKEPLENCINVYNIVKTNYNKLKNNEVPLNEELSKVTSTKGLIEQNVQPMIKLIKSKENAWYKFKFSNPKKKTLKR